MHELFITDAPAATVLVRVMTGSVFLSAWLVSRRALEFSG
jgi:hypothetical protein